MRKTIMLLGVHGVGKTYLLSKLKYDSYSASGLIRAYQEEATDLQKRVANIEGNQGTLLNAIRQRSLLGKRYILDGHGCLLDENESIVPIEREVFKELQLGGVIVLTERPETICDRLQQRDGQEWSVDLITRFQYEEVLYTKNIAEWLNIPFTESNGDVDTVNLFISGIWG